MFKYIAVPLDGSALAEKALPYALSFAKLLGSNLLLLRGAELPLLLNDKPIESLHSFQAAKSYLENLTTELGTTFSNGCTVKAEVIAGDEAKDLVETINAENVALVVMTTHGRSGFKKLIMGSVATGILQKVNCPVVVLRPNDDLNNAPAKIERIVVTLDGTVESELILEPVLELAQELKAKINLIRVVEPFVPINIGDMEAGYSGFDIEKITQSWVEEAEAYLKEVKSRLSKQGLECQTEVLIGQCATKILTYLEDVKPQMVAMATHARGSLEQIVLGSVADEVVRQCNLPVLLMHITKRTKHAITVIPEKPLAITKP
jgi:nucleotide-binding universal stress UspA family protein